MPLDIFGTPNEVRYRPNGQVDLTLTLPVTNPTSIAIGGPNMDWLIITSAKHSLSAEQLSNESQAGDVFIYLSVSRYKRTAKSFSRNFQDIYLNAILDKQMPN